MPKGTKREMFANRLEWLLYLSTGSASQVLSGSANLEFKESVERSLRQAKIRRDLENAAKSIAAKWNEGDKTEELRLELERELTAAIEARFLAQGIKAMNQAEVLARGPLNYFGRKDIRELFNVSDQQFINMLKAGRKELAEYQEIYQRERLQVFHKLFEPLSEQQIETFESMAGIRLDDVPEIYQSLRHDTLMNVVRVQSHLGTPTAEREDLALYNETYLGILFDGYSDGAIRVKPRDKFPLLNDDGTIIADLEPHFSGEIPRNPKTGFTLSLLPLIRKSINAGEQPLSDRQEKLFKEMMVGDGTVDGLSGPIMGSYVLSPQRLKRKQKPFTDSLTPEQKLRARDTLLYMYGPLRLMLNPPYREAMKIEDEQWMKLIANSLPAWDNLRLNLDQPQRNAFLAILRELNEKQQKQLVERMGVSLETLAERYQPIEHFAFIEDFSPEYQK